MDNAEATVVTGAETASQVEAQPGAVQENEAAETQNQETQPEAKYTEEDLNRIVQERVAREQQKAKEQQEEAKKLAKMTAQEKIQHELDKANARIAEMERQQTISGLKQTATQILGESGINADEALLNMVVTDTADNTQANIKSLLAIIEAKSEEMLQAKLKGAAPKVVPSATQTGAMTREQILAIEDTEVRQAAIAKNIHLFQ